MMVRALAGDLSRLPGAEVVVARDPAIPLDGVAGDIRSVAPEHLRAGWGELIVRCDAVWPIAPETDGILEEVTALTLRHGRPVLNTSGAALAIARSKRATAAHLARMGVPVAPTARLGEAPPASDHGWVVKPDDGAGAADTHFVPDYRGGTVGGAEARRPALEPLAQGVAAALPGLWGYVGADVVDGPDGPAVIEINPRLTTSYVGLAESLGINPAGLVLALREQPLRALIRPLAPRPVDIVVPRG